MMDEELIRMDNLKFLDIIQNKQCIKVVKKLYKKAFPKNERVPFLFLKSLAKKDKAQFIGVYDKDVFVGLFYNICYNDIVYVFYLAIDESLRRQGYGSKVLKAIAEEHKQKRIILMAEETDRGSDNYEERVKRKEFYYHNGFKELNYKVKELDVIYDMLMFENGNGDVSHGEYRDLMRGFWGDFLYKHVYEKIAK